MCFHDSMDSVERVPTVGGAVHVLRVDMDGACGAATVERVC